VKIALTLLAFACGAEPGDLPPAEVRELDRPPPVEIAPPLPPAPPMPPIDPTPPAEDWIQGDPIAPCPDDEWGEISTAGLVVYVKPGSNGDGSRELPFGTIKAALDDIYGRGRATVVLSRGVYRGFIPLRDSVSLVGACAAETILVEDPLIEYAIGVVGLDASISRVTIRGSSFIFSQFDQATVSIDSVLHEPYPDRSAWLVEPRTRLVMRRSILRGGITGFAMLGGEAEIDQSVFS
jgi:hypothetical protein